MLHLRRGVWCDTNATGVLTLIMAVLSMHRQLGLILSIGLMTVQVGAASAQTVPPPRPTTGFAGRYKLDTVCAASLTRFCPELASTPGQTRNQVICLKPYRTSLPLPCRSAVTATLR